ncbi:uncharacterized protein LOC127806655 isoform X2 [Diospyros lotus]|uniref:uncharacterized protein LOC127806655 isoform X2 n=1 Tax=Diospyros lotus TaxID=55363 RepID=UPI00225AB1A0|nr:uncharacterized protein LOC127806655 isoform X2 [Diospyros lotus]
MGYKKQNPTSKHYNQTDLLLTVGPHNPDTTTRPSSTLARRRSPQSSPISASTPPVPTIQSALRRSETVATHQSAYTADRRTTHLPHGDCCDPPSIRTTSHTASREEPSTGCGVAAEYSKQPMRWRL